MTATAGTELRDMSACGALARTSGLTAALGWLTDSVAGGALVCGPAGHVVVPAGIARTARHVWIGRFRAERTAGHEETLRTLRLDGETLVALRHRQALDGQEPLPRPDWIHSLAWLRLGLSQALLDHCVTYLRGRTVGEAPLLLQQLVRGSVAEAVTAHLEVRAVLEGSVPDSLPPAALADLHHQVSTADRNLSRLLGAAGFVASGPGQNAYISALLSDAYLGEVPA